WPEGYGRVQWWGTCWLGSECPRQSTGWGSAWTSPLSVRFRYLRGGAQRCIVDTIPALCRSKVLTIPTGIIAAMQKKLHLSLRDLEQETERFFAPATEKEK